MVTEGSIMLNLSSVKDEYDIISLLTFEENDLKSKI